MSPRPLTALLLALTALSSGCAHSEFDLVRPAELARHVGTKQSVVLPVDPLEYRLIAYENHLIVSVWNRTDGAVQLLANQSTVVGPNGQSHPLPVPNQQILPGSFIKLVLPPTGPRVVPSGPTIGFGFGTVFGSGRRWGRGGRYGYFGDSVFNDEPRYYTVYPGDESTYWNWDDNGTARLVLVYQRAPAAPDGATTQPAATFTHEFAFKKVAG